MLLTLETESCEADFLTYTVCQSNITNCNAIYLFCSLFIFSVY